MSGCTGLDVCQRIENSGGENHQRYKGEKTYLHDAGSRDIEPAITVRIIGIVRFLLLLWIGLASLALFRIHRAVGVQTLGTFRHFFAADMLKQT